MKKTSQHENKNLFIASYILMQAANFASLETVTSILI